MNIRDELYAQELTDRLIAAIRPGAKSFSQIDLPFNDSIHGIVDNNPRIKDRGWVFMSTPSFGSALHDNDRSEWRFLRVDIWFHESSLFQPIPDYSFIVDITGEDRRRGPRDPTWKAVSQLSARGGPSSWGRCSSPAAGSTPRTPKPSFVRYHISRSPSPSPKHRPPLPLR